MTNLELYNKIMWNVAKEVKKAINESYSNDEELDEDAKKWLAGAALGASLLAGNPMLALSFNFNLDQNIDKVENVQEMKSEVIYWTASNINVDYKNGKYILTLPAYPKCFINKPEIIGRNNFTGYNIYLTNDIYKESRTSLYDPWNKVNIEKTVVFEFNSKDDIIQFLHNIEKAHKVLISKNIENSVDNIIKAEYTFSINNETYILTANKRYIYLSKFISENSHELSGKDKDKNKVYETYKNYLEIYIENSEASYKPFNEIIANIELNKTDVYKEWLKYYRLINDPRHNVTEREEAKETLLSIDVDSKRIELEKQYKNSGYITNLDYIIYNIEQYQE